MKIPTKYDREQFKLYLEQLYAEIRATGNEPLILPNGYLSFSQIVMWQSGKESYRKKYYPDIAPPSYSTPEMEFGNKVTLAMENKEGWVSFIPHLPIFERGILNNIGGVPVIAFIDNSDHTNRFREQKTGRTAWTKAKVEKHKQMDLYSTILEIEDGFVNDDCDLIWVKTKKETVVLDRIEIMPGIFTDKTEERIVLIGGGEGEGYEIIPRTITKKDRLEMADLVYSVGKEIAEDYKALKHLYA